MPNRREVVSRRPLVGLSRVTDRPNTLRVAMHPRLDQDDLEQDARLKRDMLIEATIGKGTPRVVRKLPQQEWPAHRAGSNKGV